MKHRARYLVGGVLLLAVALPAWAGPDKGRDDSDRRDHDSHYDDRHERGQGRAKGQYRRDEPAHRSLGTRRDESRSFRGPDRHDHYDRDAGRAANAVRRDERGRVLRSEPTDDRGYRVRVLTPDGYVRERYVDPRRDDPDRHRDD